MDLKRVIVRHQTKFWSSLTKSTTFLRILTLICKNQIKMVNNRTCAAFNPKSTNGLKTSYSEIFGKLLVFFDQKYHFLQILATKTQKTRLKLSKKKLVQLLTLKRDMVKYSANFWSFLTKSTTFFRFLTLKHKKRD